MNILVTGGAGNVGKGVVAYLLEQGHSVRVIDRKIEQPLEGVEYIPCDITNYEAVREQARDMQGIVHLAAYAFPGAAPGPELFRVNATGTYHVFEAAAAEGIRRVTCASSINAFGFNFGVKEFPIQYFPIDEDHPTYTTDPYSFSKCITEEIAAYYWRRDEIASTCLRMPWVYSDAMFEWDEMSQIYIQQFEQAVRDFMRLPAGAQAEKAAEYKAQVAAYRASRGAEQPHDGKSAHDDDMGDPLQMLFYGYTDFWAAISVHDTAAAFEQSLLAQYTGSHPLFITERENNLGIESEYLLRLMFPEVTARRRPIPGNSNILSYDRARDLIGFEPRYILRERIR